VVSSTYDRRYRDSDQLCADTPVRSGWNDRYGTDCQSLFATPIPAIFITDDTTLVTTAAPGTAMQGAIHVLYQDTDQAVLAAAERDRTSSASILSTDNATSVSPSSSLATPTGSLSIGAKAGIGVGAVLATLLVFAGLLWFFHRRRKLRQQDHIEGWRHSAGMGELHGEDRKQFELEAPHGESEAAATLQSTELPGSNRWTLGPSELEGDMVRRPL